MACFSWIILFVIIWWIVSVIKKGNANNQKKNYNTRNEINQWVRQTPNMSARNRNTPQNDILSRAKQNVEEVANDDEFMQEKAARRERLQEQLRQRKADAGESGEASVENGQCWEPIHEHDRVQQNVQEILRDGNANMDEYMYIASSELMKQVEDLMIKGHEVKLPNQRDFLAEGMDMLTRYTTK